VIKVLSVFGTRPEAIKLAPVIRELQRRSADGGPFDCAQGRLRSVVCVTAQHRQMLDQVLRLFAIEPDYDLNIMQDDQSLSYVTARVLTELEGVIHKEKPDWVLVQGDTTTAMAASLAAFYQRVKVAHVEAGLRTGDKHRPYPEEMNRVIADHLADLHFAPTERAKQNLLREGIPEERILVTGNTVIDALLWAAAQPPTPEVLALFRQLGIADKAEEWRSRGAEENSPLHPRSSAPLLILVTCHRRESFGEPFEGICRALAEVARRYPDVHLVYPVHLNPRVQGPAHHWLEGLPNISLIPPLDYLSFVHLMKRSYLILTDSGGIQEEAPSLGVPVLVLREVTERPEALEAGTARLAGVEPERIVAETIRLLEDDQVYQEMARAANPYGDGKASSRIVEALLGLDMVASDQRTADVL
jgi:UDP-N-acetylglucosamine 2-epimerase (non-hydrolysing)